MLPCQITNYFIIGPLICYDKEMQRTRKVQKILLVTGFVLLAVQIPWFFAAQLLASKSQVKTTATVVRIESNGNDCTANSRRSLCDRSDKQYPVYEFFDEHGTRYEQDDRFFGEYKENNVLGKLFLKQVGDTTTAYYSPGKPQEVLFMASLFAYSAWIIPSYFAALVFLALGLLFLHRKLREHIPS